MITVWITILLIKIHSNTPVTPAQHNINFVGVCCSKPCGTVKGMTCYKLPLNKRPRTRIANLLLESIRGQKSHAEIGVSTQERNTKG